MISYRLIAERPIQASAVASFSIVTIGTQSIVSGRIGSLRPGSRCFI